MTEVEQAALDCFQQFISPLSLSVRSFNCLMRTAYWAFVEELHVKEKEKVKEIGVSLLTVSTYAGLADVMRKVRKERCPIPNLGVVSCTEIIEACEQMSRERGEQIDLSTPIKDCPPPAGVPLKVTVKDNTNGGVTSIKYPVYYAKDPYSLSWKWWFFPAFEGVSVLLPEYSEVVKWEEIK